MPKKKTAQRRKDIFSPSKRSEVMARIKSKDTKLEKTVFAELRRRGLRFQKHYERLVGRPDIALPSKKKVVFIDSDFWHGWQYPKWKHKLRTKFWTEKIEYNRRRDRKNRAFLKKKGWVVMRVWSHQLEKEWEKTINEIESFLRS